MRSIGILPDKIDKRWLLALICGAQLACLLVAGWWYLVRLERHMASVMRTQVLDSSRKAANAAVAVLETVGPALLDDDQRANVVDRVSGLITNTQLLDGGAISLFDLKSGALLYSGSTKSPTEVAAPASNKPVIPLALSVETEPVELGPAEHFGWASDGISRHFAYLRDVAELGIRIVIDQPKRDLRLAMSDLMATVRSAAILVILLVMVCGSALTSSLIHRYEDRLARLNASLAETIEARTSSLRRTRDAVIFGLARVAESRDHDTGEHLERIRSYTEILTEQLTGTSPEITPEFISKIGLASSLHDIGKVGIPDAVLLKPGELTHAERGVIQNHALIGGECLLAIRQRLDEDLLIELACQIAYTHHERWDGSGYPFGLRGEEIPIAARIVALADCYDAMTTRRVYKPAMSHEKARDILLAGAGSHFDPAVVAAFAARQADFQAVAQAHGGNPGEDQNINRMDFLRSWRATSPGFVAAEHPSLPMEYDSEVAPVVDANDGIADPTASLVGGA